MSYDSPAIDDLLRLTMDRIRSNRRLPESTYRMQFNTSFTFRDAAALVPYLSELGITHLYASPYLKAKPGSTHGYDVIDHCHLNPELGTTADYDALLHALRDNGLAHIADIVPNHVGIATNENVWWNDVLENGPASIYSAYFDINWAGSPLADLNGRVLMPVLSSLYDEELEKGELMLVFEKGAFFVDYHQRRFPISPRSYSMILALQPDEAAGEEYRSIIDECDRLPDRCEGAEIAAERHEKKEAIKRRLAELTGRDEAVGHFIANKVKQFNGTPGRPASFDRLDNLLRHQCFRLASWKTAPDEINYRRFFDVNDLAALSMERLEVFEATHVFILSLLAQNKISGLRVDHPDGLDDPEIYFHRLQSHYVLAVAREVARTSDRFRDADWKEVAPLLLGRLNSQIPSAGDGALRWPLYVLAEKILAVGEPLPQTWPIAGTSGYEFLNMTNGLFVDGASAGQFTQLYHAWIEDQTPYEDIIYSKKKLILETSFASESNMLSIRLKRIAQHSRYGIDYSLHGLLLAIRKAIACFPVYRTYISDRGSSEMDRRRLQQAIDAAIRRNPKTEPSIFHFIADTVLIEPQAKISAEERAARRRFAGKFQQLSSTSTAKGIEDTAFYIYNRLLSLNEVGGDPSRFGVAPRELHEFFAHRQRDWPYALSTLTTHDTKHSADVRARLNVLSEMPREWREKLERWGKLNAPHRVMINDRPAPDRNEEYALYQTLLGAWPSDPGEMESFKERVQSYTQKSIREAKVTSSWTDPNSAHESAVHAFIDAILDNSRAGEFLTDFRQFQQKISHYGFFNTLSQTLIKLTAPGVPDTYQGTELLDFSLVDPDNRRPVDFPRRQELMGDLCKKAGQSVAISPRGFPDARQRDCLKLAVHRAALKLRNQYPGLFTIGQYVPIKTGGTKAAHIFAFARSHAGRIAIVAAPRLFSGLVDSNTHWPCGPDVWKDTFIALPEFARDKHLRNIFTAVPPKRSTQGDPTKAFAADLFEDWPLALFISE